MFHSNNSPKLWSIQSCSIGLYLSSQFKILLVAFGIEHKRQPHESLSGTEVYHLRSIRIHAIPYSTSTNFIQASLFSEPTHRIAYGVLMFIVLLKWKINCFTLNINIQSYRSLFCHEAISQQPCTHKSLMILSRRLEKSLRS